jgi:Autoinducer binding domain
MPSLLQELSAVAHSASLPAFQCLVEHQAHRLGFERYGVAVVHDKPDGGAQFSQVDNCPDGYRNAYQDPKWLRVDPVMQFVKKNSVPLAWEQAIYVAEGLGEKWDNQNHYGYGSGFITAFHMPRGCHVVVGFDKAGDLTHTQRAGSEGIGEFLVFSSFVIDAALALMPRSQPI